MKKVNFLLLAALVGCAVSCTTTKEAVSKHEKSETIEHSSNRLCSFLNADSLSQFFSLSADSLTFIFGTTDDSPCTKNEGARLTLDAGKYSPSPDASASDDVYFFSKDRTHAATSQPSAYADGAITAHNSPKALKIYGLHVDKNINKQSVSQSSLTESSNMSLHSVENKEDNKTKSSPGSPALNIFYVGLIMASIYMLYRLRL